MRCSSVDQPPPFVAGYECVVELPDGEHRYLAGPPLPYGSLADRIPVPEGAGFPVPPNVDPALAVSVGVSGLAAWLALDHRGHVQPGETVLILGGGAVGQLAVQVARVLGAGRVVIADRNQSALDAAIDLGADAAVLLEDDMAERRRSVNPEGHDVVVDTLWGRVIGLAIDHTNVDGRIVQVGNSAGAIATIAAPSFRNRQISIVGMSTFVASDEVRRGAYASLIDHVSAGQITVDYERTGLDDAAETWRRLESGHVPKLVVEP